MKRKQLSGGINQKYWQLRRIFTATATNWFN